MLNKKNLIPLFLVLALLLIVQSSFANSLLNLNHTELKQGDILKVSLNETKLAKEIKDLKIIFNQATYSFPKNQRAELLIGISYWTKPGNYQLKLMQADQLLTTKKIIISSGNFPESYLTVSNDQEKIVRPVAEKTKKRKAADAVLVKNARLNSQELKLWKGNFIWPVAGEITTAYGATRFVNKKLNNRHSGIDIAAKKGTAIKASNAGIVKLAANLLVTGNTIIIDHGHQLSTAYSHLSSFNVKKGDQVKKGEIIGFVGSTGFSTGPHLHWTAKLRNVYVNPEILLNENL